ncbi:hypothetical protein SCORR_v1c03800 [Spiroplasma corruscae]|uniref:Lipoprotein n=1 Tax=Spiroplasma corruscae TaxID=216934 RepID=A0A222EPC1_9MOLU|nr:hypothetical protein [Spiroplasma corruscae]ASP28154.1 hypothetical protein SCORR_v1c03800 [Spiroplasma corruscae]
MRKILNILSSIIIFAMPFTSAVSCGKNKNSNKNDLNLTSIQREMVEGAEFMSRLIISSRHENININLNEMLSIYLTPIPTSLMIPTSFKYNNNNVNFSTKIDKYRNYLAPSIQKLNKTGSAGTYASYVMGMYDDSFYTNFLKNNYFEDSFNLNGDIGFNKPGDKNEMGYFSGLDKNLKLSNEESRRDLSWGIQDTGPLTNYLLDLDYDGSYPGDYNGTNGLSTFFHGKPDINGGGTNSSGYLHYNSVISKGKGYWNGNDIYKDINDKLKSGKYESAKTSKFQSDNFSSYPKINNIEFNKNGIDLMNTASNLNIDGYINNFVSSIEGVSSTDFGASMLLNIVNILTPILTSDIDWVNTSIQMIGISLIYNIQNAINKIQESDDLTAFLINNGFNQEILNNKTNKRPQVKANDITKPNVETAKITRIYNEQENDIIKDQLENLKQVGIFIDELVKFSDNLKDNNIKKEFIEKFFKNKRTPFWDSYEVIIKPNVMGIGAKGLTQEGWDMLLDNGGERIINLLSLLSDSYKELSKKEKSKQLLEIENSDIYKNKSLQQLSKSEFTKLRSVLGYSIAENNFVEGSILDSYYNLITNKNIRGVSEFDFMLDILKDGLNYDMENVYKDSLQYIYDDNYWNISNIKINSTDSSKINGELEFELNYTGVGDISSNADQQLKKVDVPMNFNPYQTLVKHQMNDPNVNKIKNLIDMDRTSGVVLGKDQLKLTQKDLLEYDGTAMNYKNVNHNYKVVWKNLSNDINNPYWVVTGIKSFNENGQEFFNIY